jgi:hypothetical protein
MFQLRIPLEEVVPTVWRRLLVPGGVRLAKLHDMFQAAMGWTNSHLHSFTIGDQLYGMHVEDWPEEELDEKDLTVFVSLRAYVAAIPRFPKGVQVISSSTYGTALK